MTLGEALLLTHGLAAGNRSSGIIAFAPALTLCSLVKKALRYRVPVQRTSIRHLFPNAFCARDTAYRSKVVVGARGVTKLVFLEADPA